jgi:hypothetical protein
LCLALASNLRNGHTAAAKAKSAEDALTKAADNQMPRTARILAFLKPPCAAQAGSRTPSAANPVPAPGLSSTNSSALLTRPPSPFPNSAPSGLRRVILQTHRRPLRSLRAIQSARCAKLWMRHRSQRFSRAVHLMRRAVQRVRITMQTIRLQAMHDCTTLAAERQVVAKQMRCQRVVVNICGETPGGAAEDYNPELDASEGNEIRYGEEASGATVTLDSGGTGLFPLREPAEAASMMCPTLPALRRQDPCQRRRSTAGWSHSLLLHMHREVRPTSHRVAGCILRYPCVARARKIDSRQSTPDWVQCRREVLGSRSGLPGTQRQRGSRWISGCE